MQPDPLILLPAIRHEVSRQDFFGQALKDGLSPILLLRASEGLAQLVLRQGELPAILRELRPAQRALLERAVALLEQSKLAHPSQILGAIQHPSPAGSPGEEDVAAYEILLEAIAASIGVLSLERQRRPSIAGELNAICHAASRIEARMRAAYKAALARVKATLDATSDQSGEETIEPTEARLTAALRNRFPEHPTIEARDLRRISGVNAQEIYFFELANHPTSSGPMVLRRGSDYNLTGGSIADEFELLSYLHSQGVRVPRVLMAERDLAWFGTEFSVMERMRGAAQTPKSLGESGPAVALDVAKTLAQFHRVEASKLTGRHGQGRSSLTELLRTRIDRFYSRWQAQRSESSLAVEAGYDWLRANIGTVQGDVSLVHGDCNFRNILIDGNRVSALLDWELAHAGHPAEDLAYVRPDIEQILPWSEFVAAYEAAGGPHVSEHALRYFAVWANVWRTSMAAWLSAAYSRGEHQNFIFATVAFHEYYTTLDDLCAFMDTQAYEVDR
ncbi:MAG: phosphotransferase family protein [Steroidobacteraceae bacterium]